MNQSHSDPKLPTQTSQTSLPRPQSNPHIESSSSNPFSPTEQSVQLQYPPNTTAETEVTLPNEHPTTSIIDPPQITPAVPAEGQPTVVTQDVRDPKSVHIPHLHLPSMFHTKENDPIHKANEYDVEGHKAEKAFLWSTLLAACLCLFGCWCFPCFPFVYVQSKYSHSTSERARRYAELSKATWITIVIVLLGILSLGVAVAIVVPSVYSGVKAEKL